MEITPVPRPTPAISRGRVLAALLVIGPVIVLVALPTVLGLHRYVVVDESMAGGADGSISRGSVALTRDVPATDLVIGDVIVFRPPVEAVEAVKPGDGGTDPDRPVTRRIVAISDGVARTRGDNKDAVDPWRLDVTSRTYPRVELAVPWVGYPFTGQAGEGGWLLLVATTVLALVLAVVAPLHRARRRQRPGHPAPYGVP